MQRTARIYICDICGTREDFDFGSFPNEKQQHWSGIDYLGEFIDLCPECSKKVIQGDVWKIILGRKGYDEHELGKPAFRNVKEGLKEKLDEIAKKYSEGEN